MKFYVVTYDSYRRNRNQSVPDDATYPCMMLVQNEWNDYGYETTFDIVYLVSFNKTQFPRIKAGIKILQNNSEITEFPSDEFDSLSTEYCSLGQSLEYYEELVELDRHIYIDILKSLRDVVYDSDISDQFSSSMGFQTSLMRFSEAVKAYREASKLFPEITQHDIEKHFQFQFTSHVRGAEDAHVINIDFSEDSTALNRIIAIIGKNGTGKTQILANFANAMSGLNRNDGDFSPERPSFDQVISISYRGVFNICVTRGNLLVAFIDFIQIQVFHQTIPFSVLTPLVMVRYTT